MSDCGCCTNCFYSQLEARAEDVVKSQDVIQSGEISNLLRKLNAKCNLGFESVDEWSRNILYNKKLDLTTFENAVSILQETIFKE